MGLKKVENVPYPLLKQNYVLPQEIMGSLIGSDVFSTSHNRVRGAGGAGGAEGGGAGK